MELQDLHTVFYYMNHREWNMQISGYGAAQAPGITRTDRASSSRAASFQQAVSNELGGDQVSISESGKAGAATQAGVLSASEKTFFNDSFGTNVFGADAAKPKGPVVSNQGASVLDSQEISFFQNAFGMGSQTGGARGASMGSSYAQASSLGSTLNRAV